MSRKDGKRPHAIWDVLGAMVLALLSALLALPLPKGPRLVCLGGCLGVSGALVLHRAVTGKWGKTFVPGMFFLLEWMILSGQAHMIRMETTLIGKTTLFWGIGLICAALVAGVVFWLLYGRTTKETVGWSLFLAAFAGLCSFQLGYDLACDVNVLADRGLARETVATVTGVGSTSYVTGRYTSARVCFVTLQENELTGAGRVKVTPLVARELCEGDRVRLILHPGALGVPWLSCGPLGR